jgi:hypothetical protein
MIDLLIEFIYFFKANGSQMKSKAFMDLTLVNYLYPSALSFDHDRNQKESSAKEARR